MFNQKRIWVIFFMCEVFIYTSLFLRFLSWGGFLLTIYEMEVFILAGILMIASLTIGVITLKIEIKVKSENPLVWGILASVIPFLGLYRMVVLKKWGNLCMILMVMIVGSIPFWGINFYKSHINLREMNTGIISLNYRNRIGNQLTLDFKSASDGFTEKKQLDLSNKEEILSIKGECSKGFFIVEIAQGDKSKEMMIGNGIFEEEIALDFLDIGKFYLKIHVLDAENTKIVAKVE